MHHGSTLGTVPLGLALLSSNVEEERSAECKPESGDTELGGA